MQLHGTLRRQGQDLLRCRATWCWLGAILVPGLWLARGGWAEESDRRLFEAFGLNRTEFSGGQIWQVATHGFLHGNGLHLALNAALLLLIGSRIEHYAGRKTMSLAVAGGVLGGGLLHLIFSPGTLVGISGGCMALVILLGALSPDSRMAPLGVSAANLGKGILIAAGLLMVMNPGSGVPWFSSAGKWLAANGFASWFQIGHACHFGGGLVGLLIAIWVMRAPVSLATLQRQRARREGTQVDAAQKRRMF